MKLFLTAFCASFMILPSAFAGDCDKCKKGEEKKEEGTLAHCGKCEGDKKKKEGEEKKEEGTVAACDKCKKDGEEKKEEGTFA